MSFDPSKLEPNPFVTSRLVGEFLHFPSRTTIYIEQMNAWYDIRTREEVMNSGIFSLVQKSIGTPGLVGLDKLLSFMIVKELQV